jgi:hypothetical protein
VDDIAVISPNQEAINSFINSIKNYFKIKELGLIKDYLRVEINYRPKNNYLKFYQAKYIKKILNKYGFQDLKPAKTLMDPKVKLVPNKIRLK